jgi:hypothetical protein
VSSFFNFNGSVSSKLANKSPAPMTDPGERLWIMLPLSDALSSMIIYIASTSTYGCPGSQFGAVVLKVANDLFDDVRSEFRRIKYSIQACEVTKEITVG